MEDIFITTTRTPLQGGEGALHVAEKERESALCPCHLKKKGKLFLPAYETVATKESQLTVP